MPIRFVNIHKAFGTKAVLKGVDFTVEDGECFFIIGASGVGKSVLIKHLIGLLRCDEGDIFLGDHEVSRLPEDQLAPVRKQCAMVFQNSTLFDSMTCAENVALPLRKHRNMTMADAIADARDRLAKVQMREFADAYPAELGDGMRKRVAIARALTLDPKYVLFDEPTTSLDPISARRTDVLIRRLCDEFGVTSIVVSHDLASIFSIADRIAMLYKGTVRLLGTPEEFQNTDDPIVRQFIRGRSRRTHGSMSSRKKGLSIEVRVGLLVLVAATLLAGFVFVLGGVDLGAQYSIYVDYDNPGNVLAGCTRSISAAFASAALTRSNTVASASNPQTGRRPMIRMHLRIDEEVRDTLHEDALFYIASQSLLGESIVAVRPRRP